MDKTITHPRYCVWWQIYGKYTYDLMCVCMCVCELMVRLISGCSLLKVMITD